MQTPTTVSCLCGALSLELSGPPLVQLYCHCDDCQAVHAAAYVPAVLYPHAAVRVVAGQPLPWKRNTTLRATCPGCGTRRSAEPPGGRIRSVPACFLPAGRFRPEFHMQCRFALLPVKDTLPHYAREPARLGGSDEQVSW